MLRPHAAYAAAYLDDVIIHIDTWAEHVRQVVAVLESLRQANSNDVKLTCLTNSRKTHSYIRTPDKVGCPSRTRKQNSDDCQITLTIM